MKKLITSAMCVLALSLTVLTSQTAQAVPVTHLSTIDVADCTDVLDPCVLSGPGHLDYFFGSLDAFQVNFKGMPGEVFRWHLTALLPFDLILSGTGDFIGPNGEGASAFTTFLPGQKLVIEEQFDAFGDLTFAFSSSTTVPDGNYAEENDSGGFVWLPDLVDDGYNFGDPSQGNLGQRSCALGETWNGSSCVIAAAPAVPLPAAGLMLFAGIGGFVCLRRRKRRTA